MTPFPVSIELVASLGGCSRQALYAVLSRENMSIRQWLVFRVRRYVLPVGLARLDAAELREALAAGAEEYYRLACGLLGELGVRGARRRASDLAAVLDVACTVDSTLESVFKAFLDVVVEDLVADLGPLCRIAR